ncbi:MAG: YtxH domain-containing protein [Elusimicrobiota bacterium]|nr:YtxH domain-containing protein [Elusimicrobiota bacterium]
MANDNNNGLLGFIAGAAVGAALGVLFAPRSGKETREQLGDWLKDRREKGEELLARVKEEAAAKKDAVTAAAKAAKSAYVETNAKHHDGVHA